MGWEIKRGRNSIPQQNFPPRLSFKKQRDGSKPGCFVYIPRPIFRCLGWAPDENLSVQQGTDEDAGWILLSRDEEGDAKYSASKSAVYISRFFDFDHAHGNHPLEYEVWTGALKVLVPEEYWLNSIEKKKATNAPSPSNASSKTRSVRGGNRRSDPPRNGKAPSGDLPASTRQKGATKAAGPPTKKKVRTKPVVTRPPAPSRDVTEIMRYIEALSAKILVLMKLPPWNLWTVTSSENIKLAREHVVWALIEAGFDSQDVSTESGYSERRVMEIYSEFSDVRQVRLGSALAKNCRELIAHMATMRLQKVAA